MMFRVNYSKAFDAHAHMKTENPRINFALQQTCLAVLIASIEMLVELLLSCAVMSSFKHQDSQYHFAVV